MQEGELYDILKKIVAIHLTDYFPRKKCIKPRFSFQPFYIVRDTTHFTLNAVAQDLGTFQTGGAGSASWSNKSFAIICPFDKLYALNGKNLQNFNPQDTFFTRIVKLPEGTVVLILPSGIDQAIKEKIISQEEMTMHFGEYTGPVQIVANYFEKKSEGISYRIYNWHAHVQVKDLALRTIHEMGYPYSVPDKLVEINQTLGFGSKIVAHDDHWTKSLENFSGVISITKRHVDNIVSFLSKLDSLGIKLPTYSMEHSGYNRIGFPNISDKKEVEKIIDVTERTFSPDILDTFSREENEGAWFYSSCLDYKKGMDSTLTLLRPVIFAEGMLLNEKIPKTYHKIIIVLVKDYQKYVREHIPMAVIILMPHLQEALSDSYMRESHL